MVGVDVLFLSKGPFSGSTLVFGGETLVVKVECRIPIRYVMFLVTGISGVGVRLHKTMVVVNSSQRHISLSSA